MDEKIPNWLIEALRGYASTGKLGNYNGNIGGYIRFTGDMDTTSHVLKELSKKMSLEIDDVSPRDSERIQEISRLLYALACAFEVASDSQTFGMAHTAEEAIREMIEHDKKQEKLKKQDGKE